jgi:hypothetical protein
MGKMQNGQKQQRKPGEVNVDYKPGKSDKPSLDDVGEYTDFEEIEDDK